MVKYSNCNLQVTRGHPDKRSLESCKNRWKRKTCSGTGSHTVYTICGKCLESRIVHVLIICQNYELISYNTERHGILVEFIA